MNFDVSGYQHSTLSVHFWALCPRCHRNIEAPISPFFLLSSFFFLLSSFFFLLPLILSFSRRCAIRSDSTATMSSANYPSSSGDTAWSNVTGSARNVHDNVTSIEALLGNYVNPVRDESSNTELVSYHSYGRSSLTARITSERIRV